MCEFELYLYLSGQTAKSSAIAGTVRSLLNSELEGRHSLEVINVLDHPQRTENDNILATPTLVKAAPPPEKRVVGDLSDRKKVAEALGLTTDKENQETPRHPESSQ